MKHCHLVSALHTKFTGILKTVQSNVEQALFRAIILFFMFFVQSTALVCGFTCTFKILLLFGTISILPLLIFIFPLSLNGAFCPPVVAHYRWPRESKNSECSNETKMNVRVSENQNVWNMLFMILIVLSLYIYIFFLPLKSFISIRCFWNDAVNLDSAFYLFVL